MPIHHSTMNTWLSIFESNDISRTHTLVSSPFYDKIYQKLYAGAYFKKEIDSYFIEVSDNPVIHSPFLSKETVRQETPLLLPFSHSENWYSYAMLQLEQYFVELYDVPANLVSGIANALNIINMPDYYTIQMIDVELSSTPWKWHGLRDEAYPTLMSVERHDKLELQIFFMLLQLWLERLSKKGETSSMLVFIADTKLAKILPDSVAWRYLMPRLLSLNIYLVLPYFEYNRFNLASPPLLLGSDDLGLLQLSRPGVGMS